MSRVLGPTPWARSPALQVVPGEFDREATAEQLLGLAVRVRGIKLGRPVDLLLDLRRGRVLGFEILCGDKRHRFLPFSATILADGELLVPSALVLVDEEDAGFYRERTVRLSSLQGLPVEHEGRDIGLLLDVTVDAEGLVVALAVDFDGEPVEVPCADVLQLGGGILRC